MPTAHQNRTRYWLFVRWLMRWRTPILLSLSWFLLTLFAAALFELSQRLWLAPVLAQSHQRLLDRRSDVLRQQLQTSAPADAVAYADAYAAAHQMQIQWTAMRSVTSDGDAVSRPEEPVVTPTGAVTSAWQRFPAQVVSASVGSSQSSQAATGSHFRLVRVAWPWYSRADVLAFLLVSCGFYAPTLGWFYYRFMRNFTRMSNRLLDELSPTATLDQASHESETLVDKGVEAVALDLPQLGRQLQDQLTRITRREQDASRSAQASLRVAAHEIRRPLQRLTFAIQSLEEPLQQQAPKLHLVMNQALDEMADIVEEALWYSRLNHGPLPLNPHHFAIENLAMALVEPLRDMHPEHDFRIEPGAPTPAGFRADRKLLERAVANLLSNAVKYGDGKVLLSWQWTDDELLLTVHDNGPGVPAAQRKTLFEPFMARSGDMEERPHGGLGLAIVKEVCVSHGGKVRMKESPLGGVAVILCLPMSGLVTVRGTE